MHPVLCTVHPSVSNNASFVSPILSRASVRTMYYFLEGRRELEQIGRTDQIHAQSSLEQQLEDAMVVGKTLFVKLKPTVLSAFS